MNLYEMFDEQKELTLIDALRDFLPIAVEHLELDHFPKIKLVKSLGDTTFGRYVDAEQVIYVVVANRNPVDVLRTLAHEMVHYAQGLSGELSVDSGKTGSPIENEANAGAGVIMRLFNTEHPKYLKMSAVTLPTKKINESVMRNAVLVATLASALASGPVYADPAVAIGQAIGVARVVNKMKGYGVDAARGEATQELNNLVRALAGQGNNHSHIYPLIKDMVEAPGPLPTDEEQLPSID